MPLSDDDDEKAKLNHEHTHSPPKKYFQLIDCSKRQMLARNSRSDLRFAASLQCPFESLTKFSPQRRYLSQNSSVQPADLQSALKPREVVDLLDKYIIGQHEAKRAVAIALRNRWRRHQLPPDLKSEVSRLHRYTS